MEPRCSTMKVSSTDRPPAGPILPLFLVALLLVPTMAVHTGAAPDRPDEVDIEVPTRVDVDGVNFYLPSIDIPETPPEYIIICPREFVNASLPLASHRTQLGLSSRTYAIEDIVAVYEGFDREEEVHMFLRALRSRYPSFQWLLILGDSEHLAPRQLWHYAQDRGQPFENYYPSDVYYAGLGSDWDDNGNHLYGELSLNGSVEADLDWDIYVGRVPASTETQASDSVQKVLRYERNPPVGAWMKRFLNWGSLMEPPNLDTGTYKYQPYKGNAYKVCSKVGANLPEHIVERPLYDYPQLAGGQYVPSDGRDTLNRNNMLSELNNGASLLNFAGQARYEAYAINDYGPPTGSGTEYDWNEPLRYSDAESLVNGDMTPFMYASSCDVAKFFQTGYWEDRSLETFITSPSGGLIGFISSTGTSARGEEQNRSWGNWYLDEQFWKLFFNQSVTRPGMTLFKLKETYRDEWFSPTIMIKETILGMIYAYILLGDPYTDIYTDTAKRFMLQGALTAPFYTGEHTVRFQVLDREMEPVAYPDVTFYAPQIYLTVKGDADGWVEADLDLKDSTLLNFTLSGHNMVPSFYKVIVLPEIADMALYASDIEISPSSFEAGENITVSVRARNLGGLAASDVTLSVEMESFEGEPKVQLPQAAFGQVLGKGQIEHQWTLMGRPGQIIFRFRVGTSSPQIDVSNDVVEVNMDVLGPYLRFEQGSGIIRPSVKTRPGSPSSITYSVLNEGMAACSLHLGAYLGDPQENGTLLVPLVNAGRIGPGQWANGSVQFTFPSHSGMLYLSLDPMDLLPPSMEDPPLKQLLEVDEAPVPTMVQGIQLLEDPGITIVPMMDAMDDPDTPWPQISIQLGSSENLTASLLPGQDGGSISFEPFEDWYGETSIGLMVDDGSGAAHISIPVTVVPVNDPPIFLDAVEGYMELVLLEDVPFSAVIRAFDVENDGITFSSPGSPFSLDPKNGTFEWTPGHLDAGTEDHIITADDGHGGRTELVLRILVVEMNDPPVVGPIDDISLMAGESRSLDLSIEDEEGGPFIITSSDPMVTQKGDRGIYVNGSAERLGKNLVRLTVSDGVNSVLLQFNVTVTSDADGDGNESSSLDPQLILAGVGIALIVFSALLILFFFLRRSTADKKVRAEKEGADKAFNEETGSDTADAQPSGGGGAEE